MINPQEVEAILMDSLSPTGVLVQGVMRTFGIDLDKLEKHRQTYKDWIAQLPTEFLSEKEGGGGGYSMLNLCVTKDGELWTGMQSTTDLLFVGAAALGLATYLMPREMWRMLPGSMPYMVFTTEDPNPDSIERKYMMHRMLPDGGKVRLCIDAKAPPTKEELDVAFTYVLSALSPYANWTLQVMEAKDPLDGRDATVMKVYTPDNASDLMQYKLGDGDQPAEILTVGTREEIAKVPQKMIMLQQTGVEDGPRVQKSRYDSLFVTLMYGDGARQRLHGEMGDLTVYLPVKKTVQAPEVQPEAS